MTPRQYLMKIRQQDPDGWITKEPTDRDRSAFRLWVIDTYGLDAWEDYCTPGWYR
jgi:hypothetical protein